MVQSDKFKHTEALTYVGNFPGARRERDLIATEVTGGEIDITDRRKRALGTVTIDSMPDVVIDQDQPFDVSAETVPVTADGTLPIQEDTPLDVSASTVSVQESTPLDVSASTVAVDPTANVSAEAFENGTSLAADGTLTTSLAASSAETLVGRVSRASTSYDVTIDWKDDAGNVLFTDTIASGVAAGTETSINEAAVSPYCNVNVVDAGSASGAVTSSLHLR